jgi:putative ABC transport system permease protein
MQLTESFKIGIVELAAHKLRSFLTMLGVIFGVAAVVAVVAIGLGAQQEALRQIAVLGTDNIRIRRTQAEGFELQQLRRNSPDGLTRADADALGATLPHVTGVVVRRDTARPGERDLFRVHRDGESPPTVVAAVSPNTLALSGGRVARGRFLNPLDEERQAQVAVLGASAAAALFPVEDPLGETIQLGGLVFRIVGVMERRQLSGNEGAQAANPNIEVYIPMNSAWGRIAPPGQPEDLSEIALLLEPGSDVREVAAIAERALLRRHRDARDFELVIPELLLAQKQATQRIFSLVLIFIAGISLLVGGIGIMNIMLATVTQRTKEIGVRRAIGATRDDILVQFLVEAVLICLVGGCVGLGLGFGLSKLAEFYAGWPTIVSVPAMAVAIGVASLTGIVFGLYPSMKAARLDPIEALRHE